MSLRSSVLASMAALLALPVVAGASGRPLEPPHSGAEALRPFAGPLREGAVAAAGAPRARATSAEAQAAPEERSYRTRSGYNVRVAVSSSYTLDNARVQAFVDFLDTRLHGSELGRLHVLLATGPEIAGICGPEALACYDPRPQKMIVPGDQTPADQPSLEYVITHEYGHHIARNRSNAPWSADTWGPKHWATVEHVCSGVVRHRLFPGDEGDHYYENPGEAWAESYATYHYRSNMWRWTPLLKPGDAAFGAIRHDVSAPWRRTARLTRTLRFARGHSSVVRLGLRTLLDGALRIGVGPSRHQSVITQVVIRHRLAASTLHHGVAGDLCGVRSLQVRVLRRRGYGRVRVSVTYPG
ncbi:MAG: hypothetical protein QOK31_1379 [Solirubrobacteraceae bacterium]|nr:hypothetical protein [Solirubrobacteraceae bacterium]